VKGVQVGVRETEARVFLGEEAKSRGLVDGIGDDDAVENRLEELLEEPIVVTEFVPSVKLPQRLMHASYGIAYAFGAGIGRLLLDEDTIKL
jgi:protease-4